MTVNRARQLRKNPTEAESFLWSHLRYRQLDPHKFRRQHPIGTYVVDFACLEKLLIIEIDGGHHALQVSQDWVRSKWLQSQGFVVLRFWNNQVLQEIESVKMTVLEALKESLEPS